MINNKIIRSPTFVYLLFLFLLVNLFRYITKIHLNEIYIIISKKTVKNFYNNKIYNSESFTLDNTKLKKALNISIKKKDLKIYCLNFSKKIFSKIN